VNTLRRDLERTLITATEDLLSTRPPVQPKMLPHLAPAAALLWTGNCCTSGFIGDRKLLQYAGQMGDALAAATRKEFVPQSNPPHLVPHALADALTLLEPQLTSARRKRWREVVRLAGTALSQYLEAKRKQLGRPGPYTGTGPNHLFRHAATLYRIGRVLANAQWSRQASAALRRMVALQDPQTGCFPEQHGPVVAYHWVTLDGLARYLTSGGATFALEPLRRGIEYAVRHLYPDLVRLELFDERNRLRRDEGAMFHPESCVYHPQGRRLLALALQARPAMASRLARATVGPRAGYALSEIARALTVDFDESQRAIPVESARMTLRMDHAGLLRRRYGWFYGLSTLSAAARPHHPFHMDRTANIVLYHDRVGRVVAGGYDKETLESATFRIIESGECGYFPAIASRLRSHSGCDRLHLDYGAAQARLEIRAESAKRCRLTATGSTNMRWRQVDLNLQLWLPHGETIHLGAKRTRRVLRPRQATKSWPTNGVIELPGRYRIETVGDAELIWPYRAYNVYGGPPHLMPPEEAVAILRVPLEPVRDRADVTFRLNQTAGL